MTKRSLYQCLNAKVKGELIGCKKGYVFDKRSNGFINLNRLAKGSALEFKCCQECPHFDYMGKPVPKEERGWLV